MKKLIYILGIITLPFVGIAQQEAMFTHYMFNTLSINPAYAGSRDALTITGIHRSQWVGIEGAPITQTVTAHTPIHRDELGVGLSIINDRIGPTNTTSLYGDIAYRLKVTENAKLAFGLKAGLNLMQSGLSNLKLTDNDGTDQSFVNNIQSKALPNFGFGMYYSTPKFYVGLSSPRILQNNFISNNSSNAGLKSEKRHYFLIGGAVFQVTNNIKFKPTTFLRVTSAAPLEADLTASLLFHETLMIGLMGRSGDAVGLLVGINATPQLGIGYSFDWSFGVRTGKYNGGSHELMIRYDFIFRDKEKIQSPRYF
ncbi:type IX secretion system membrane protein PorP/SprF [Flavobacteriales bacterium]|nr:type IX secretion system membrane protein PorP/SprF [Flavobacteriales bacterium]